MALKWRLPVSKENFNKKTFELSIPLFDHPNTGKIVGYIRNKKSVNGKSFSKYIEDVRASVTKKLKKVENLNLRVSVESEMQRSIYSGTFEGGELQIGSYKIDSLLEVVDHNRIVQKEGQDIYFVPNRDIDEPLLFFEKHIRKNNFFWYKLLSPNDRFIAWFRTKRDLGFVENPIFYTTFDSSIVNKHSNKSNKEDSSLDIIYVLEHFKSDITNFYFKPVFRVYCNKKGRSSRPVDIESEFKTVFKLGIDEVLSTDKSKGFDSLASKDKEFDQYGIRINPMTSQKSCLRYYKKNNK
jgi:hypothetical protein